MSQSSVPPMVSKYFWGDNLAELSWQKHHKYIIQTLLEKGDTAPLRWLFEHVTREEVKRLLPTLRLQKRSHNFWSIYLS